VSAHWLIPNSLPTLPDFSGLRPADDYDLYRKQTISPQRLRISGKLVRGAHTPSSHKAHIRIRKTPDVRKRQRHVRFTHPEPFRKSRGVLIGRRGRNPTAPAAGII